MYLWSWKRNTTDVLLSSSQFITIGLSEKSTGLEQDIKIDENVIKESCFEQNQNPSEMKSPVELAIGLGVVLQVITITVICCWETPNTVAAEDFVTIVRRYKSNRLAPCAKLLPDKFIQHNSSCTQPLPNHCYRQTKQSLVTSPTPQCECVCDNQQPTIRFVNHKWSCVRDDVTSKFCGKTFLYVLLVSS